MSTTYQIGVVLLGGNKDTRVCKSFGTFAYKSMWGFIKGTWDGMQMIKAYASYKKLILKNILPTVLEKRILNLN